MRLVARFERVLFPGSVVMSMPAPPGGWREAARVAQEFGPFSCTEGACNVRVCFLLERSFLLADDHHIYKRLESLSVEVEREMDSAEESGCSEGVVPDVLCKEFTAAASAVLSRLLQHLRYSLRAPLLGSGSFEGVQNPRWTDDGGRSYRAATLSALISLIDLREDCVLDLGNSSLIQGVLKERVDYSLECTILSEAVYALDRGELRRAIIECAVACEIAVKESVLGGHESSVIESLENSGSLQIRILGLISRTTLDAFGKSFRTDHQSSYREIDHLFRARNKAVHRGRPEFRDDAGVLHVPDEDCVRSWIVAVDVLRGWLGALR